MLTHYRFFDETSSFFSNASITQVWVQCYHFSETQSGFYAKKGTSFHISHALIRQKDNLAHHVFRHVIQNGDQVCFRFERNKKN